MPRIVGFAGSLRKGSFNALLLRAAVDAAPQGTTIEIASIAEIPLYNFDVETGGIPAPVEALKNKIAAADGLLIVTPEYNSSIPGVAKNAIDWLSRPPKDIGRVFGGLPVAIMGATPGQGGTIASQNAWLPVLKNLTALPWFGARMSISGASKAFDAEGRLLDEASRAQLQKFVAGFAAFTEGGRRR